MKCSINKNDLARYVGMQLDNLFPQISNDDKNVHSEYVVSGGGAILMQNLATLKIL